MKFIGMTEEEREEKLKQQLAFFDYIYPQMSARLCELEKNAKHLEVEIIRLREEKSHLFEQYKNKIQRIEWFLIKRGLIELLGEDNERYE